MTERSSIRKNIGIQLSRGSICLFTTLILGLAPGAWASPNSVTLNWTAPGDDGNTGTAAVYDIRYSTAPINGGNWGASTQASGEPSPQVAGSAESFTVTGLTPSTTYYFAIQTADEVPNWSSLSNVLSVTTDAEDNAPTALADLLAVNPTDSSIGLTWTATGDDGANGTASQYDIRYATSAINDGNWNAATQVSGEPSPQVAGSAESITVYGLSEGVTYFFAAKVADEVPNWSGLSNVASGATGNEAVSPNAPSDLIALNPTGSSVILAWTATGDDGDSGTASYYDIRYSTQPINDGNWDDATNVANEPTPQAAGNVEYYEVLTLTHSTEYFFALKVADEVFNWSGRSNVATATTNDETAPAGIADLQVGIE